MININIQFFGGRGSSGSGGRGGRSASKSVNDEFPEDAAYSKKNQWAMRNTKSASEYSKEDFNTLRNQSEIGEYKMGAILDKANAGSSISLEVNKPYVVNGRSVKTETWRKLKSGDWKMTSETKDPGQLAYIIRDKYYNRVTRFTAK